MCYSYNYKYAIFKIIKLIIILKINKVPSLLGRIATGQGAGPKRSGGKYV